MAKKFKAKPGSRLSDSDANLIGKFILKYKLRTAEELVRLAHPKESPLHRFFEWDEERAAHEYRLLQARRYWCSIVEIDVQTKKYSKKFYSIDIEERRYEKREEVLKCGSSLEFLEKEAYSELCEICLRVEGLRFFNDKRKWKRLVEYIRSNDPR